MCLASPGQPLVFATVVRRDPVELAEEQPMIGLAFEPGPETEKVLGMMGCGPIASTVLVQVSVQVVWLAYKYHVTRTLNQPALSGQLSCVILIMFHPATKWLGFNTDHGDSAAPAVFVKNNLVTGRYLT